MFNFVVVYGLHTIEDRKSLWEDLGRFVSNIQTPCIMMGDYNAIYQAIDVLQGNYITHAETVDFSNFLVDNCLSKAPTSWIFILGVTRVMELIDSQVGLIRPSSMLNG